MHYIGRENIKDIVKSYVTYSGKKTRFRDGRPGPDWMLGWEKRWEQRIKRKKRTSLSLLLAYNRDKASRAPSGLNGMLRPRPSMVALILKMKEWMTLQVTLYIHYLQYIQFRLFWLKKLSWV